MTHGSLFSGIGGFDLAAEWMGWQNVFHCEWNIFGQRVLKHYWPDAISYHDITKTDFTIHRGRIDILTGGFPCQPYSTAGKRLGKADARHLWPEMCRAIREIQPAWIVGENVRGLISWNGGMVFDEVQAELEAEGYSVLPFVLPACAVNAPHRRDRVFFVAYAKGNGSTSSKLGESESRQQIQTGGNVDGFEGLGDATDTNGIGCNDWSDNWRERQVSHDQERSTTESESERSGRVGGTGEICGDGDAADTGNKGVQGIKNERENRGKEIPRFSDRRINTSRFFCSKWQKFPTVSPICDGNDGISDQLDGITFSKWRQESIKAGGNAVVPQVVLQIFRTIEEYEKMNIQ